MHPCSGRSDVWSCYDSCRLYARWHVEPPGCTYRSLGHTDDRSSVHRSRPHEQGTAADCLSIKQQNGGRTYGKLIRHRFSRARAARVPTHTASCRLSAGSCALGLLWQVALCTFSRSLLCVRCVCVRCVCVRERCAHKAAAAGVTACTSCHVNVWSGTLKMVIVHTVPAHLSPVCVCVCVCVRVCCPS